MRDIDAAFCIRRLPRLKLARFSSTPTFASNPVAFLEEEYFTDNLWTFVFPSIEDAIGDEGGDAQGWWPFRIPLIISSQRSGDREASFVFLYE